MIEREVRITGDEYCVMIAALEATEVLWEAMIEDMKGNGTDQDFMGTDQDFMLPPHVEQFRTDIEQSLAILKGYLNKVNPGRLSETN